MKTELKAKFLQHMLNNKKSSKGFTLIELLVVIIIIGILSAIALPSFLNQAAKAKQTEAKNYVGAVNRAQQAYRIEQSQFAGSISALQIGIPTETTDYTYDISSANATSTAFDAYPKDDQALKSYAGGVIVLTTGQTEAVACQTEQVAGLDGQAAPNLVPAGGSDCGAFQNMR
jgi:type IV pilus assembly protein PilA